MSTTERDERKVGSSVESWTKIRRIASHMLKRARGGPNAPLCTWSLVNRAAIRFGDGAVPTANDTEHYYAQWRRAMSSVLIDLSRKPTVRSDVVDGRESLDAVEFDSDTMDALSWALVQLAERDKMHGDNKTGLIILRHFEGMTWNDVASTLGSNVSTLRRDWNFTLAWLATQLRKQGVSLVAEHEDAR